MRILEFGPFLTVLDNIIIIVVNYIHEDKF